MMSYLSNYTSKSKDSYDAPLSRTLSNTIDGYRVVPDSITDVEVMSTTEDTDTSKGIITFKVTVNLSSSCTNYYLKLKSNQVFPIFKVGSLFDEWNLDAVESRLKELSNALSVRKSLKDKVTDVDLSQLQASKYWKSTPIEVLRSLSDEAKASLFTLSYPNGEWKEFILSYWSDISFGEPSSNSMNSANKFIPQEYLNALHYGYDEDGLIEVDLTPLNFNEKDINDLKSINFWIGESGTEYATFKFSSNSFHSSMYLSVELGKVHPNLKYGDNSDKLHLIKSVINVLNEKAKDIDKNFDIRDALSN
jgi:hypothetical protein